MRGAADGEGDGGREGEEFRALFADHGCVQSRGGGATWVRAQTPFSWTGENLEAQLRIMRVFAAFGEKQETEGEYTQRERMWAPMDAAGREPESESACRGLPRFWVLSRAVLVNRSPLSW